MYCCSKTHPLEVTRISRENNGPSAETWYPQNILQNSPMAAAQLALDKVLRRNGTDSNAAAADNGSRNSSSISIRFSKKAAEESEDEPLAVLDVKVPPPAEPVPTDVEVSEKV